MQHSIHNKSHLLLGEDVWASNHAKGTSARRFQGRLGPNTAGCEGRLGPGLLRRRGRLRSRGPISKQILLNWVDTEVHFLRLPDGLLPVAPSKNRTFGEK